MVYSRSFRKMLVIEELSMVKRLINITDASEYLGIKKTTLYSWIHQKQIPYIKMGRLVKFDLLEIDDWILQKRVKVEEIPDYH